MKKFLPYIAGGILLTALIVVLVSHRQQRHFDGRITLNPTHKIPYGAYVSYQLMQQQFPKAKLSINRSAPLEWKLPKGDTSNQVLFILISYFNPTDDELNTLTAFAQKGNTVFISALQMSEKAQQFFRVKEEDMYDPYSPVPNNEGVNISDSFTVRLDSTRFTSPVQFSYSGVAYNNRFTTIDSTFTYPLGYNKKGSNNLVAIHTLKGTFFLHSAPITFTNFFLLSGNNHIYFEQLMSLLPADTKYLLWDEYFTYRKQADGDNDSSILHVLLKYENFRWAFWLSLIALAVYLLTEVKRRQRLVPDRAKPANDTLAFVSTIGKLYYERGDHKNLAEKLSVYFLDFVRNKYKISTTEINAGFTKTLSLKSNIPLDEITAITDKLIELKLSDVVSQQQLMDYHKLLEHFYSKT